MPYYLRTVTKSSNGAGVVWNTVGQELLATSIRSWASGFRRRECSVQICMNTYLHPLLRCSSQPDTSQCQRVYHFKRLILQSGLFRTISIQSSETLLTITKANNGIPGCSNCLVGVDLLRSLNCKAHAHLNKDNVSETSVYGCLDVLERPTNIYDNIDIRIV
ncbi:hypothetical protein BU16DRAFT_576701 [Lophium mytilinum]|uniref:Uncharacterized protein n=1 Tax=Lophium mytilinum TaxID=390894 RepID=A0A6A6RD14_9PEZI|nr:hypothetical protein BU16DRAFT_576701 [Lophium mytilinum]